MDRPEQDEYAEDCGKYISLVDGDVIQILDSQSTELRAMFENMPDEKGTYRYADDKWTLKEILCHLIDGERIFSYRVLRVSRGDTTPIEGFEQDDYIENSNANNRTFRDLLDEFDLQRRANVLLVRNLSDDAAKRIGTTSGYTVSARALVYVMAGHMMHHLMVLKQRYSL